LTFELKNITKKGGENYLSEDEIKPNS